jgi:sigma54-dependent transcription regulator
VGNRHEFVFDELKKEYASVAPRTEVKDLEDAVQSEYFVLHDITVLILIFIPYRDHNRVGGQQH